MESSLEGDREDTLDCTNSDESGECGLRAAPLAPRSYSSDVGYPSTTTPVGTHSQEPGGSSSTSSISEESLGFVNTRSWKTYGCEFVTDRFPPKEKLSSVSKNSNSVRSMSFRHACELWHSLLRQWRRKG